MSDENKEKIYEPWFTLAVFTDTENTEFTDNKRFIDIHTGDSFTAEDAVKMYKEKTGVDIKVNEMFDALTAYAEGNDNEEPIYSVIHEHKDLRTFILDVDGWNRNRLEEFASFAKTSRTIDDKCYWAYMFYNFN